MKKLLAMALTLAASTILPASAMAIDTGFGLNTFQVSLLTVRDWEADAGYWYLSLDSDDRDSCNYAVEWVSPTGLISSDCILQEAKIHGRRSCLRNELRNFPTFVNLLPDCDCQGFDQFALLVDVVDITLTENRGGLSGAVLLAGPTGFPMGIDIIDC